jgi:AcrR family transcriptional regulator
MLQAAAELIADRGFADTRVADVARRAGVSSGLVLYYFTSLDQLLVEALRFSDEAFYAAAETQLWQQKTLSARLETLVRLTLGSDGVGEMPGSWGLWLDLWAQAYRHPEVARGRLELDQRWRQLIADVVRAGRRGDGRTDVDRFAFTFAALLDGLAIQLALDDPAVDAETAVDIALEFARRELGLRRAKRPPSR